MYLTTRAKHLLIAGITLVYSFAKASLLDCYNDDLFGWIIGKLATWPLLYAGLGSIIDSLPAFNQILSRRILIWYGSFLAAIIIYSEMYFGFGPAMWLKFPRIYFSPYGENLLPCADYRWFILVVITTVSVALLIRLRNSSVQHK